MSEHMIRMHMAAQGADPDEIEDAVGAFADDRIERDKDDRMEADRMAAHGD